LEELNLNRCDGVNDAFLTALAQSCAGLKALTVLERNGITDVGVREVMQSCNELHTLDVQLCSGLSVRLRNEIEKRYKKAPGVESLPARELAKEERGGCACS
jgi:hypothetical protein